MECFEEALVIAREVEYKRIEAETLESLGMTYKQLGNLDQARECWRQALGIFETIEHPDVARVREWLKGLD